MTAEGVRRTDLREMLAVLDGDLERLSGRRLLITGGAGFLGHYLVQLPLAWNDDHPDRVPIQVVLLDNFFRGLPSWLTALTHRGDLRLVEDDVRIAAALDRLEFDWVIHAAGIASPTVYRRAPIETMDANIVGLRKLLDRMHERGPDQTSGRMLFFSSSEIYGDPEPDAIPTPETYRGRVSCTGPRACYDESKRYGETLCVSFAHQHGIPVVMARPFNNFGPGMGIDDGRVVADLCRDALRGQDLLVRSDGSPTRTFCYVADAVTGYYLALLRGRSGEPYNVGIDGPETTIADLAARIAKLAAERTGVEPLVRYEHSSDPDYLVDNPERRCPDITKARRELGFAPSVDLDEGLRRSLAWFAHLDQECTR